MCGIHYVSILFSDFGGDVNFSFLTSEPLTMVVM